ncbi:MAG TPA: DUF983 domain-containing protein [Aggregatilineales bacterium]|nr:DUF983 domain-containing protein [Aggregatilineales bacterium]
MNLSTTIHKLWLTLWLRCPHCERGAMTSGLFRFHETCPVCNARFERREGESIGGTMINLVTAELLTMGGLIITQAFYAPPVWFQLTFWIAFNILFIIFFYRHARALWIGVAYLAGYVYPDESPRN